jgi:sporulation protein YlmC with PRC-barrel domain
VYGGADRAARSGMTAEEQRIYERASALDTREDIVAGAEESLGERGYAVGPVDGVLDARTVSAVRDFQRDQGFPVTGRLDADTLAALDVGINMSRADPHPGAFTAGIESPSASAATRDAERYPPRAEPGSDRWLEQRVFVRLVEAGIGPDVVVVADGRAVTLTGSVDSETARRRATEIARGMPDVRSVQNRLGVRSTAASPPTGSANGETQLRDHPGGLVESRWLIGRPLVDADGRAVGRITHVWFDPGTGRVEELVVDTGGGAHRIVPWRRVDVKWRGQNLVLAVAE